MPEPGRTLAPKRAPRPAALRLNSERERSPGIDFTTMVARRALGGILSGPVLVLVLLGLGGCAVSPKNPVHSPVATPQPGSRAAPTWEPPSGLDPLLWARTSAELAALRLATFQAALRTLESRLADPAASALDSEGDPSRLAPAVIADLDETLLDNSRFEAERILTPAGAEPPRWSEWVERAEAEAVPGALEFSRRAQELGVTIFYITNREVRDEPATRRNLARLGFPLPESPDTVLSRGERPEWQSDKESRRRLVAASYRVLLLLGDDLNDFLPAHDLDVETRRRRVEESSVHWGYDWFLLPNPLYGSWKRALLGRASDAASEAAKREALRRTLEP